MPRSARSHERFFVGTDGRITVWRRTVTVIYRSVVISEFRVKFRQARDVGKYIYPVEQIGIDEWVALRAARGARGGKGESWIDNADLPPDLVLPIPGMMEDTQ